MTTRPVVFEPSDNERERFGFQCYEPFMYQQRLGGKQVSTPGGARHADLQTRMPLTQIRAKMLDAANVLLRVEDEAVVERIKVACTHAHWHEHARTRTHARARRVSSIRTLRVHGARLRGRR